MQSNYHIGSNTSEQKAAKPWLLNPRHRERLELLQQHWEWQQQLLARPEPDEG